MGPGEALRSMASSAMLFFAAIANTLRIDSFLRELNLSFTS